MSLPSVHLLALPPPPPHTHTPRRSPVTQTSLWFLKNSHTKKKTKKSCAQQEAPVRVAQVLHAFAPPWRKRRQRDEGKPAWGGMEGEKEGSWKGNGRGNKDEARNQAKDWGCASPPEAAPNITPDRTRWKSECFCIYPRSWHRDRAYLCVCEGVCVWVRICCSIRAARTAPALLFTIGGGFEDCRQLASSFIFSFKLWLQPCAAVVSASSLVSTYACRE